jgi:hypothetical protein
MKAGGAETKIENLSSARPHWAADEGSPRSLWFDQQPVPSASRVRTGRADRDLASSSRAVKEYLATLTPGPPPAMVVPKFVSPIRPQRSRPGRTRDRHSSNNYLIDVTFGAIVDVRGVPRHSFGRNRCGENHDRADRRALRPQVDRFAAGTPYKAAPMLSWLVEEKDAHTFR